MKLKVIIIFVYFCWILINILNKFLVRTWFIKNELLPFVKWIGNQGLFQRLLKTKFKKQFIDFKWTEWLHKEVLILKKIIKNSLKC